MGDAILAEARQQEDPTVGERGDLVLCVLECVLEHPKRSLRGQAGVRTGCDAASGWILERSILSI